VTAYSAVVIGAGAIGAQLDDVRSATPLTHAGGYRAAGFTLTALVDPGASVQDEAKRWACASFSDLPAMMRAGKPDVISVATPTKERAAVLRQILISPPRVVIAEKPLAETVADGEDIVRAYEAAGIPLIVNYSRRFTPLWQRMRGRRAMSAAIRYGKGLRHNGTHAIDLCRMLFGECLGARALTRRHDHWPDDPSVSAFLEFERCTEVFLQALDERAFTFFEVDIVAAEWRLVVESDGRRARHFELRDNVGIPSGRRLVEVASEDTGAASAMLNLMQNLRDVLEGGAPLCTGEDAVAAQRIAEQLAA
jgi:predicted dehydrogenase